jgi:hypothetical protein
MSQSFLIKVVVLNDQYCYCRSLLSSRRSKSQSFLIKVVVLNLKEGLIDENNYDEIVSILSNQGSCSKHEVIEELEVLDSEESQSFLIKVVVLNTPKNRFIYAE